MAMAIFDATEDKEWLAQAGLKLLGVCSSQEGPRLAQFVFFFVILYNIFVLRSLLLLKHNKV